MDVIYLVASERVGAELRAVDQAASLTLFPGGAVEHLPIGPNFREELFRVVQAHLDAHGGQLRLIRYRGDLGPITILHLGRFGVPILPER